MTSTSTNPASNELSKESIDGIRAPAVAVWPQQDGSSSFHDQLSLYIRYNAPSRAAFFSLRTNVSLKDRASGKGKADRWLYLQIPPEHIQNLSLDLVADGSSPVDYGTDEHSEVAKRLNANPTNIVCLRFDLNQSCRLVVPEGQLIPKNKHSGEIIDLHKAAARQNQLRVYAQLPDRLVSRLSLSALCTAACNAGLTSVVQDAKISGLYGGKDGRILDVAAGAACLENPPSYDQVEPGPPMPPLEPSLNAGKKRQRCDSDGASEEKPVSIATLASQVEEMSKGIKSGLAQLMDQVNHMKKETGIRLDKLEAQMNRVEARTNSRMDDLESEVRSRIDFMDAGSTQSESESPVDGHQTGSQLRSDLERQIDDTRTDLMNEVHDLESEMRETREFLEEGGLEDRIRDILDGARFSIHT